MTLLWSLWFKTKRKDFLLEGAQEQELGEVSSVPGPIKQFPGVPG